MDCRFTPAACHVNLGAIARNFRRLGPREKLLPVVKSDAYGHGLLEVATLLDQEGATGFAVGTVAEGVFLRRHGFRQTIIPLLGCNDPEDWDNILKFGVMPLLRNTEDVATAAQLPAPSGRLRIALKCETGMGRLGFHANELQELLNALEAAPNLEPFALLSHLACADMPEEAEFTEGQIRTYDAFYQALKDRYPALLRSLSNSAASLARPELGCDLIRPGLALYGGNPLGEDNRLEWAMSVSAPIIQTRILAPGESVSYGRTFTAQKATRIGIVGAGYANGISRALSGKASFLVCGKRVPQVGRICMGMLAVDLEKDPEAKTGDRVWIIGGNAAPPEKAPTPWEIAALAGTIPYELLCLLGSLNPRTYENN